MMCNLFFFWCSGCHPYCTFSPGLPVVPAMVLAWKLRVMLWLWLCILCFLFSWIMAWRSCSMSYSYPLNRFCIESRRSSMAFSSNYSGVSFSNLGFVNGGLTSGLKGDSTYFSTSAYQSISLSQICALTSAGPFSPSLFDGFLCSVLLIKSAASILHPVGKSLFLKQIYFENI